MFTSAKYRSKKIIVFLPFLLLIYFAAGCSSSSYSGRYHKKESEKEETNGSVRFSSEKNNSGSSKKSEAVNQKEFDEDPVEDNPVDKDEFIAKYKNLKNLGVALSPREKFIFEVVDYLDTPYKYGGESKNGIDCSGFTQNIFQTALNYHLPRTASEQYLTGEKVGSKTDLNFGDLVFFDTTRDKFPGHVGVFLGNNLFVHSSLSKGVSVSSLESDYWKSRYVGAKRISGLFK